MPALDRLKSLSELQERIVVGLNSGTSMDAIDALCVRLRGAGTEVTHEVLAFMMVPHPPVLRRMLLRAPALSLEDATILNVELGEGFAGAAAQVAEKAGLGLADVHLIGSHGQTVCHLPRVRAQGRTATLQLGDLDVIAERTGVVAVGDFRARDVAAGGEGAPLMPYLDWLLFRKRPRTLALNLGGIANVTLVMPDLESCQAFDVGPANLPLDLLAARLTNGAEQYDPGGRFAAQGQADPILLDRLLGHPFLLASPPKTTGRESFGEAFVEDVLARNAHLSLKDILATMCCFIARAIHRAVTEFVQVEGGIREVVVSGGGLHNLTLMRQLKSLFFPVAVTSVADHGIDPDAKEALLFAVLANERVCGGPANVPRATGASWPAGLGKIAL